MWKSPNNRCFFRSIYFYFAGKLDPIQDSIRFGFARYLLLFACLSYSWFATLKKIKIPTHPSVTMSTQTFGGLELRPLGNTGLKVSSVGFGASPLGNVFGNVSEEAAFAAVRHAFRLGINFFDTSPYAFLLNFFPFLFNFDWFRVYISAAFDFWIWCCLFLFTLFVFIADCCLCLPSSVLFISLCGAGYSCYFNGVQLMLLVF